jgi:predicted ferric reductase
MLSRMKPQTHALQRFSWYALYALGMVITLVFWWQITGHMAGVSTALVEIAIGNVTGLIGTYCILWQLMLLSRLTFLENAFGMERLTWLHKWNGYSALIALLVHTIFLIIGYALLDHVDLVAQFLDFLWNWEDLLKATVGMIMLIIIVFISIGIVRRRMKYETWYLVHIFTYLAILLAFSHQLSVGSDFVGQPLFQAYWYALYILAVGTITLYRFVRPVYLVYKYRFRVEKTVRETPDVLSVYITGGHLDRLHFEPGQFMIWRFLSRELWWQAHPFSISVGPGGRHLRITVKQLGDFTRSLSSLKPGTYVSVDGPHGNFTTRPLSNSKLLLIAGGVGITPIRSILEHLPAGINSVVLVHAVRNRAQMALHQELESLIAKRKGTLKYILSAETAPGFASGTLDAANLRALVPDAASREVMLCGPPLMMDAVTKTLVAQGVARRHIHTERFAY